jgi:hypothetical protein
MTDVSQLSDQELDRLIARHEKKGNQDEPDYSQQYKRGYLDPVRDLTYGGLHSLLEGGETLGNVMTLGHLKDIPGYNWYLPKLEKGIEKIKSPYPSKSGDLLKIAGEWAIPEGIGANVGRKAIVKALKKYPIAFTEKGATKGLERLGMEASEAGGKAIAPETSQQVLETLDLHPTSALTKGHMQKFLNEEGFNPAFEGQKLMGQTHRALTKFSAPPHDVTQGNLINIERQRMIKDMMKYLEEKVAPNKGKEMRLEQQRYKNYKKLQKNIYEPAKKYAAPFGIGYELLHLISKLLKH